jgi:hypothetical protein
MCDSCGEAACKGCPPYPNKLIKEHTKIRSRTTGRMVEIQMQPGHAVPRNPFASISQMGYLHAHPEKLGKAGLKEWDAATKGKHLPQRAKKAK